MVAFRNAVDTFAHADDYPGPLMPEDGWERIRRCTRDDVPVAVAHPGRRKTDLDFSRAGLGQLDVLDDEGFVELSQDGCAHAPIVRVPFQDESCAVETRSAARGFVLGRARI